MGEVTYPPHKYKSQSGNPSAVAQSQSSGAVGTTGAVVATLAGVASRLLYITGLAVGRTAGAGAAVTVAGLANGNLSFSQLSAPLVVTFDPPIPAAALGGAITVTSAADGTGVNVSVSAWGFAA